MLVGIAAAIGGGSCGRSDPPPPDRAVREMFAAFAARDCARLMATVGGALEARYRSEPCEQVIEEIARGAPALIEITKVEVDGRRPERRLAYVRWESEGKARSTLAKLEREGDRWVVVDF